MADNQKLLKQANFDQKSLEAENARLRAENWVLKDSRLRTYDGLAQKAARADALEAEGRVTQCPRCGHKLNDDFANEKWKDIPGFDGRYQVSDYGRVRSIYLINAMVSRRRQEPKILVAPLTAFNRHRVVLRINGASKAYAVARLVLMVFVGPCPIHHEAAHLDGDSTNDRLDNLKWATKKENSFHKTLHGTSTGGERAWNRKLSDDKVRQIHEWASQGLSTPKIAKRLGVHSATVGHVLSGRTWRHVAKK